MNSKIVIVGGGLSGLVAAKLLADAHPEKEIVLLEGSAKLGGLLGSVSIEEADLQFDYGMHWITECGIQEVDGWLWNLMPESDWNYLTGAKRHLAGAIFRDQLQYHTHFPDLRVLREGEYRAALDDFLCNLEKPSRPDLPVSIADYADERYGSLIARSIIDPIVRRVHRMSSTQVSATCAHLPPIDRVVMFDEPTQLTMMGRDDVRRITAFPDQRRLPLGYSSGRSSFYPKHYGMCRVIDAIEHDLRARQVTIITQARVQSVHTRNHVVQAVEYQSPDGIAALDGIYKLIWAVNQIPLSRTLSVLPEKLPFDPLMKTVLVHLVLDHPPHMRDLYHLWVLDGDYRTYRVTYINNYCSEALLRTGGHVVCVELVLDHEGTILPEEQIISLAKGELTRFGVLDQSHKLLHESLTPLQAGFPFPMSIDNVQGMDKIRRSISALNIDNLQMVGVMAEPGLFFQTDIMQDIYRKVEVPGYDAVAICFR